MIGRRTARGLGALGFRQHRASGELRFAFGRNWRSFLRTVDERSVTAARDDLSSMLETSDLRGQSFLDIGSGSGLSSLAARTLGATVHSIDLDPDSVRCTWLTRERFADGDPTWTISCGSVLDTTYMDSLPKFDVVYAWGVLHHTGDLRSAMEQAARRVSAGGRLYVALYNDEGRRSRLWRAIKSLYCKSLGARGAILAVAIPYYAARTAVASALLRRNLFAAYRQNRGMHIVHDWLDWLGGYPFEVIEAGAVLAFYRERGFDLLRMKTTNGSGNNRFVFQRR